jgi:hypothetical protein
MAAANVDAAVMFRPRTDSLKAEDDMASLTKTCEKVHKCQSCHQLIDLVKDKAPPIGSLISTNLEKHCLHSRGCIVNALTGAAQSASVGIGIKVLVVLLRSITRRKLRVKDLYSEDVLRFGAFLGSFAGIYKSVNCILRHVLKEENKLNSFIAGSLAGLSLLVIPTEDRVTIAVYIWIRSMLIAYRAAEEQAWFPKWLRDFEHGDFVLGGLGSGQILYAYIFQQDTLPSAYRRFLKDAGRQDQRVIDSIKRAGYRAPQSTSQLTAYMKEKIHAVPDWHKLVGQGGQTLPCAAMHPGQGCFTSYVQFVAKHIKGYSLRLYAPLTLVTLIIFRRKKLMMSPSATLLTAMRQCFYSSLFLSTYCGNAWLVECWMRRLNIYSGATSWWGGGFAAASALFFEMKSRRLELALYIMSPASQSAYRSLRKWNLIPKIHYIDTMLFGVSMGIMMMAYQRAQITGKRHMTLNAEKIMHLIMGLN